ncbi:hypothetical protein ACWCYY_34760 [Kitasatospora sp. NPDC001664]
MSDVLADPPNQQAAAPLSPVARQLLVQALALLTESGNVSDHQAVAELQALATGERAPVLELEPIAYVKHISDAELRLADVHEKRRAAEWPWDVWCRLCLAKVSSDRTEEYAAESADQHVAVFHVTQSEVHALLAAVAVGRMPMPEPVVKAARERWKTRWDRCELTWRPVRPTLGEPDLTS